MTGTLLDTNVVSELTKSAPAAGVVTFLDGADDLWISAVTVHELRFGLALMADGKRREGIRATVDGILRLHRARILPMAESEATHAAALRASAQQAGHRVHLADALIAGTAKAHDLSIATRNVKDFESLGVILINPWEVE